MRFIDGMILVIGIAAVAVWATYSTKNGFKGSSAMIVARSISFSATLGGQVANQLPAVGSKLNVNDLLVRIHNGRVDRTRLAELQSQRSYLESEIQNTGAAQRELALLSQKFAARADAYDKWFEQDVQLRQTVATRRLEVAKKRSQMKSEEVTRLHRLLKKQHASEVLAHEAGTEAIIAKNEVDLASAELQRSHLLLKALHAEGISSDTGNINYWAKTTDELKIRHFDTRGRIALLKAELVRTMKQIAAEKKRIDTHYAEEHLAPFAGVVNATFVTQGARVAPGTNLLQVLDCSQPTVIIPIPEHRMGQFSVGMTATIHPVDSEESLSGSVTHISSGPLLGHDTSIQLPLDLTKDGNRAIVSLDAAGLANPVTASCQTARKAVAIIHSRTLFDRVSAWAVAHLPASALDALGLNALAARMAASSLE